MIDNAINLNDTELYLLIFLILFCNIGTGIYCICCKSSNNRVHPIELL